MPKALEQFSEVFLQSVRIVVALAPFGVLALMAWPTGTMGLRVLVPLTKYLV